MPAKCSKCFDDLGWYVLATGTIVNCLECERYNNAEEVQIYLKLIALTLDKISAIQFNDDLSIENILKFGRSVMNNDMDNIEDESKEYVRDGDSDDFLDFPVKASSLLINFLSIVNENYLKRMARKELKEMQGANS